MKAQHYYQNIGNISGVATSTSETVAIEDTTISSIKSTEDHSQQYQIEKLKFELSKT